MEYDFRYSSRPPPPSTAFQPPSLYPTFPPPTSETSGIRVAVKPNYTIKPPPPLLTHEGDIPRSNFLFQFQFERNVLAEAVNDNPNWSRLLGVGAIGNIPSPRATDWKPSYGPTADRIVNKCIITGVSSEAVPLAVANYGDNPVKFGKH